MLTRWSDTTFLESDDALVAFLYDIGSQLRGAKQKRVEACVAYMKESPANAKSFYLWRDLALRCHDNAEWESLKKKRYARDEVDQQMILFIEVLLSLSNKEYKKAEKSLAVYRKQRGFVYSLPSGSGPNSNVYDFSWATSPENGSNDHSGDVQQSSALKLPAPHGNNPEEVESQKKKRKRKEKSAKKISKKARAPDKHTTLQNHSDATGIPSTGRPRTSEELPLDGSFPAKKKGKKRKRSDSHAGQQANAFAQDSANNSRKTDLTTTIANKAITPARKKKSKDKSTRSEGKSVLDNTRKPKVTTPVQRSKSSNTSSLPQSTTVVNTPSPSFRAVGLGDGPLLPINAALENSSRKRAEKISSIVQARYNLPPVVKPPLPDNVRPKIWSKSRQSLCESFMWFRAYQSGVYHTNSTAFGYLLSAYSSARDIFHHNGKLIVSHGGGKSQVDTLSTGEKIVIANDQAEDDLSVRALLESKRKSYPVALVADDHYRLFPYDLGKHTYVVLGLYRIVEVWAEEELADNQLGYCRKYKFAFQWCEGQGKPWWWQDNDEILSLQHITSEHNCLTCGKSSPRVYSPGWVCLNPRCEKFWRVDGTPYHDEKTEDSLLYCPSFLSLRSETGKNEKLEFSTDLPNMERENTVTTSKAFIKGWWCSVCGMLSSRDRWECYHCDNCDNSIPIQGKERIPKDFWPQEKKLKYLERMIGKKSGITAKTTRWSSSSNTIAGARYEYTLPENQGTIHVIKTDVLFRDRVNDIFQLYQKEAEHGNFFRRYPMKTHALRGTMLSNYFSQNSGAPYKYVVGTNNTVPFEHAPRAVTGALALIKECVEAVLGKRVDFNEILSAAYMEGQSMSYHSDSEPGLGPIVSSLSMGSIAHMHFRRCSHNDNKANQRCLSLVLRHGDVLVMEGADIQNLYEHTVVPFDFRIAATARYIAETKSYPSEGQA